MVVQFSDTENHCIVYLNGWMVWYMNYISIKLSKITLTEPMSGATIESQGPWVHEGTAAAAALCDATQVDGPEEIG